MASVLAMEDELQHSAWLSDDAEYDTADSSWDIDAKPAGIDPTRGLDNHIDGHASRYLTSRQDDRGSDESASAEDMDEEEDAPGDANEDSPPSNLSSADDEQLEDADLEMEDQGDSDAEGDAELEQGVEDIRLKEGESDEEDELNSGDSDLQTSHEEEFDEDEADEDVDDEDEEVWEEAGGVEDEESDDELPPHSCLFCKQDEEKDAGEDDEAYIACTGCGEHAHQQCARDAFATSQRSLSSRNWRCPECLTGDSDPGDKFEPASMDDDASAEPNDRSSSQLSDGSNSARRESANSHRRLASHGKLSDDLTGGGSRTSRKRRTTSTEPDETANSLRKRRRGLADEATAFDDREANPGSLGNGRLPRTLRLKVQRPPSVVVEKRSRTSLVLRVRVRPGNLKEVLSRRKRHHNRGGHGDTRTAPRPRTPPGRAETLPLTAASLPTPFTSDLYSQPFYSFFDKEIDDAKGKPYGGILTEVEADTSKTLPTPDDRRRFDQAKQKAEDEWRARLLAMQAETEMPARKSKKSSENASQIECIEFGGWEIDTWYAAPYPAEYSRNRVLYICEFCLKYMNSDYVAWRHKLKCAAKHPPGDEIYRHESVSVFEVDGRKHPVYCRNLCLLAKLFLGSKTLYYDVEPFLFYVLCEYDECGYHFVGYFSKEKRASSQNNVSCILTLPIHQRKGYGNLLIDFSYLLTRVEEKTGSPEKPLSDMGLVSYRNYWRLELCRYFLGLLQGGDIRTSGLSVKRISDDTGMTPDDIISALEGLRALVREPQSQLYAFRIDLDYCREYVARWESKGYVRLKPEALAWTPYVMGRSNAVNFELGPPISAMAPREDDEYKGEDGADGGGADSQLSLNGGTGKLAGPGAEDGEAGAESKDDGAVKSIEEAALGSGEDPGPVSGSVAVDGDLSALHAEPWAVPYRDIAPTQFEVFPPLGGSRRADRARHSGSGRPLGSRTGSGSSRPKRPSDSGRRSSSGRMRTQGSHRKTGGTGRGPGRWPKGTKKSDYGNADSGPGLPPGWVEKQARMRAEAEQLAVDGSEAAAGGPATQGEVEMAMPDAGETTLPQADGQPPARREPDDEPVGVADGRTE